MKTRPDCVMMSPRSSPRQASASVRCLVPLVLLLGCGGKQPTVSTPDAGVLAPDSGSEEDELAPYAGWPQEVTARRVGDTRSTSVVQLEPDGRGGAWLMCNEWSDGGFLQTALESYSATGQRERRVTFGDGVRVRGFVVHPSGRLTVFRPTPVGASYRLDLLRLSADGEILETHAFTDTAGPRENLYYDELGVHENDGPLFFNPWGHVVGLADGEGLYLYAWTFGAKLYRLDAGYRELWDAQIMPSNKGMGYMLVMFNHELLAVDERSRVYVAYQIFADDVAFYNQHFARAPLTAIGNYDILVERFEPDGAFSAAQVFGGPGGDMPTGLTVRDGAVLVTGATRSKKHDLPNRTLEWDLLVLRGDLDDPARSSYRTLDLSRDDLSWAMVEAPDGTILLGGRTNYVHVDTNSEVEDGKGLLVALSPDLTRKTMLTLPGPRDVQVQAMRLAPDGRLWFAGIRDGYLTHTPGAERHNQGVLGTTRLGL